MIQPFTVYDLILGYGRSVARGDDRKYIEMVNMLHKSGFLDYSDYSHIYQYFHRFYKFDGQVKDMMLDDVALYWSWEDAEYCFTPDYAKKVVVKLYDR